MNVKSTFYLIVVFTIVSGCVSQSEYDSLLSENERLKAELDECLLGEERLVAIIEKSYSEKDYPTARQNINALLERHPESSRINDFKKLLLTIEKAELAEAKIREAEELAAKKKREVEEAERIRLANLNNTGIWIVSHYVDDFGEPTKQAYIRNRNLIKGAFSNTATQDSDLNVKLLISNSSDISIMLYEYAGNNPVNPTWVFYLEIC